jgi:hypothetical protein
VFHGAQHPPAAGRGPGRHFQGHLLVGGKFELEVGLPGNPLTPVADFRGGSPGIGGHQGDPGFQGAPDNGLIPQEEPPLPAAPVKSSDINSLPEPFSPPAPGRADATQIGPASPRRRPINLCEL